MGQALNQTGNADSTNPAQRSGTGTTDNLRLILEQMLRERHRRIRALPQHPLDRRG